MNCPSFAHPSHVSVPSILNWSKMDPKVIGSEHVQETKASDTDAEPSTRNSITGDVFVHDSGADTELRRILSTRHLTMIALGSSIGMGLWLGSGTSLIRGGPAGIFLGYCLSGMMIWSVVHSLGEMAVVYPLPSAFVQWTGKFVDPSAAFALGWAYYFSFAIIGESPSFNSHPPIPHQVPPCLEIARP